MQLANLKISVRLGLLGAFFFLALVFVGLYGERDPMHNLMTLVFWTGVWIVVPLGSMLLGNLWRPLNPWTGPVRIGDIRRGEKGEDVFSASRSLIFKSLRVKRIYDEKNQVSAAISANLLRSEFDLKRAQADVLPALRNASMLLAGLAPAFLHSRSAPRL